MDTNDLKKKIYHPKSRFIWIKRGVDRYQVRNLEKFSDRGLILRKEPQRNYLYNSYAAQVIGCTNIDNMGVSGLEMSHDSILSGNDGFLIMTRGRGGKLSYYADQPMKKAADGASVQLTLDMNLQQLVEYELRQGILRTDAAAGTVIALDVKTSEVLAMASYPGYNPNSKTGKTSETMRIRAITDMYEPGSTFKMITAAAAMNENMVKPEDRFYGYHGLMQMKDYKIKDEHPFDSCSFADAVRYSSNIVFSTIADNMSDGKFYKYVRDFGFGIKTDIDLPGEVQGRLKKPDQFTGATKRFMGHGYGLGVTPLQLINAYACIANEGVLMKPYIIKRILDRNGNIIAENQPEKIRGVISSQTAKDIANLFCAVVDSGTGTAARIKNIKVAGKTGTSQQLVNGRYTRGYYTASFAGFFPAESPEIAMIVIVDRPKRGFYGGSTAAPIFKSIAGKWIAAKGINNLSPEIESDSVRVPNLIGLDLDFAEDLLDEIDLEFEDSPDKGTISYQIPAADSVVEKDSEISIKIFENIPGDEEFADSTGTQPNLKGLSIRNAIKVLRKKGIDFQILGSGKVKKQYWQKRGEDKFFCKILAG
jgi:cell division protein FtsI (penicillin-binding protein 3)